MVARFFKNGIKMGVVISNNSGVNRALLVSPQKGITPGQSSEAEASNSLLNRGLQVVKRVALVAIAAAAIVFFCAASCALLFGSSPAIIAILIITSAVMILTLLVMLITEGIENRKETEQKALTSFPLTREVSREDYTGL